MMLELLHNKSFIKCTGLNGDYGKSAILELAIEKGKICSSDIKTVFLLLNDMLRANDLDTTKLQKAMKELTGVIV